MQSANNARERAQELRQKLHTAAKASPTRRFHALYDKLFLGYVLEVAWQQVAKNGGAPGVDGQTIKSIREAGVAGFLEEIARELREGTYRPQPVIRVYIPKVDGSLRPLGIPTVKDRVVQAAAKLVMEPIFEADFTEDSYGFRPGRGPVDALEAADEQLWQNWFVVDADIERYFDNVDHSKLMELLRLRISDRRMLALIESWLKCGVVDEDGRHRSSKGTPQGGVLSPLLANVYLHCLDKGWQQRHHVHGKLIRYADDFVILCKTRMGAKKALAAVEGIVAELRLRLHPTKTRIVELVNGQEGFDFLGAHLRKVRQVKRPKEWRPASWPSSKAMRKVRGEVGEEIRKAERTEEGYVALVEALGRYLGGWANYFKHTTEAEQRFRSLDYEVKSRLLAWRLRTLGSKRKAKTVEAILDDIRGLPRLVRPNNRREESGTLLLC